MKVLVDSSIWIGYFRSGEWEGIVDALIEEDLLVVNDLILAELVPFLELQKQNKLLQLMHSIAKLPLYIDWMNLITMQTNALKNGANGIGIPDLIVAQNALQYEAYIFSGDKHFALLAQTTALKLYPLS